MNQSHRSALSPTQRRQLHKSEAGDTLLPVLEHLDVEHERGAAGDDGLGALVAVAVVGRDREHRALE